MPRFRSPSTRQPVPVIPHDLVSSTRIQHRQGGAVPGDRKQFLTRLRLVTGAANTKQTFLQGGNDCLGLGFTRDPGKFRCQLVCFGIATIKGMSLYKRVRPGGC